MLKRILISLSIIPLSLWSFNTGPLSNVLPHPITTCIQENAFPPHSASFRLLIKKPSDDNAMLALDTSVDQVDKIDHFFARCRQHLQHYLSRLSPLESEQMVIVAVGDFDAGVMTDWIQEYFSPNLLSSLPGKLSVESVPGIELHIDYPLERTTDLQYKWVQIFAQQLLQQRLERSTRLLKEHWVHPHPQFLNPVHGFARVEEEDHANALAFLIWEIEQIKTEGFHLNEFLTLKENALVQLAYLNNQSLETESAQLASFYADLISLEQPQTSYPLFVKRSQEIVQALQFSDLQSAIDNLLREDNEFIHVRYPAHTQTPRMTRNDIQQLRAKISQLSQDDFNYQDQNDILLLKDRTPPAYYPETRSQIVINPNPFEVLPLEELAPSEITDPFYALPLTDADKMNINFIITNMAEKNIFELAFDKKKMEEKGKQINHVHPLRFIGHIFSDYELKKAIRKVSKNSFKWDAFVDGFIKRAKEEYAKNNMLQYISGFAEEVDSLDEKILYYVQQKDWKGLLAYLM